MKRVVYLHGFASGPSSSKARFLAAKLRELGATVEIPDLNTGGFENLTITGQLEVVEQTCRGQKVSLIGSSMGGYLAALYAARHPEVERLVLLAPAFSLLSRWEEAFGTEQAEAWRKTGFLTVYHYGEGRERRLSYNLLEDGSQYEAFPDFRQPGLIFHGIHDDTVPPELSEQFAATHPNVQLKLLDSDHQLTDVIDRIWSETREFLGFKLLT